MFFECSRLIDGNQPRLSNGITVTDVDGDGAFELVVTGYATNNLILKWDGSRLVDIAGPLLADPSGCAVAIAAADVDGDGREELYVLNSDRASGPKEMGDRLFACFGKHWLDLLAQPENAGMANRVAGRSVIAMDRHGHGRYGFVVAADGGPFRLFELSRRGRLEDAAEDAGIDLIGAGRGLLALPFLSDRVDLFACNEGGPNFLFRNLGRRHLRRDRRGAGGRRFAIRRAGGDRGGRAGLWRVRAAGRRLGGAAAPVRPALRRRLRGRGRPRDVLSGPGVQRDRRRFRQRRL
ncbi:FG-GAP-like repeat-containing protein [Azospirillum baldaniorum]|uniref:VCBS repeat-containing protein n=1 Tax=Azospirillum baldaniorum TaxID=1064539 RepID=A0A9P1JPV2_9PROT|nr:FG-GAP-like repeat-containing protein [Azospirillum baldaniorum]CCC97444.1 conserved protein of unknown function [Azospirillum baldaniorum]